MHAAIFIALWTTEHNYGLLNIERLHGVRTWSSSWDCPVNALTLSPSHPSLSIIWYNLWGAVSLGEPGSWLDEAFVSPSSSPLITSDDIRGPLIDQFFSGQPSYWSTDNDQSIRIGTENGWMAGGSFESLTSFRSHLLFICLDIDQYHCMFNVPESR